MSNLTDFIGGGGGIDPREFTRVDITTSQTWTVPAHKGKMFVICSGGGGGGFYDLYSYSLQSVGGASGEIAYAFVDLSAVESVNITIGVGGASAMNSYTIANIPDTGGATDFGGMLSASGGTGGVGLAIPTGYDYSRGIQSSGFIQNSVKLKCDYIDSSGVTSISDITNESKILVTPVETFIVGKAAEHLRQDDTDAHYLVGGANSLIGKGGEARGDVATSKGVLGGGGGSTSTNDSTAATGGDGFVLIYYIPA